MHAAQQSGGSRKIRSSMEETPRPHGNWRSDPQKQWEEQPFEHSLGHQCAESLKPDPCSICRLYNLEDPFGAGIHTGETKGNRKKPSRTAWGKVEFTTVICPEDDEENSKQAQDQTPSDKKYKHHFTPSSSNATEGPRRAFATSHDYDYGSTDSAKMDSYPASQSQSLSYSVSVTSCPKYSYHQKPSSFLPLAAHSSSASSSSPSKGRKKRKLIMKLVRWFSCGQLPPEPEVKDFMREASVAYPSKSDRKCSSKVYRARQQAFIRRVKDSMSGDEEFRTSIPSPTFFDYPTTGITKEDIFIEDSLPEAQQDPGTGRTQTMRDLDSARADGQRICRGDKKKRRNRSLNE